MIMAERRYVLMKCKKCGKEINEGAKFCENCGTPVSEKSSGQKQASPKRSSILIIVLLCILIGIMIFVAAAVGAYMFMDNESSVLKESYDKRDKATAQITAAPATAAPIITAEPYDTPKPTAKPVSIIDSEHIAEPTYKVYADTEMGFSCAYPTHFEKYNDNTSTGRYTLRTSDKSVSLRICAENNDADITLAQSMSMFKTKNPGDIEYSKTGNTYYAIRINDNGICRYRYLVSKNQKLYWFDFNYPEEYRDIYENYIDHIYRSFTVR